MKHVMHYNYAYAFAKILFGTDWGYVVAIADEMVDRMIPGRVPVESPGQTKPIITQSYEYSWWHKRKLADIHSEVWIKFHFGGKSVFHNREGKCVKGSELDRVVEHIKELVLHPMSNATCPEVYMALGILLHIYQDSFSHEGFRGWRHKDNSENRWYDLFVPDIGHAEYGNKPDTVGCKWKRHGETIDNTIRFMEMHNTLVESIRKIVSIDAIMQLDALGTILGGAKSDKDLANKLGKIDNYINFVNDDLDTWFFAARGI